MSREQFSFCHIRVPDIPEKLSAIEHDGQYYSIFKPVDSAEESLEFAIRASISGHELVITEAGKRYILWIHEPKAVLAKSLSQQEAGSDLISVPDERPITFFSAPCLIIADSTLCQFCYLSIPGRGDRVPGFHYHQSYYSLIQREPNARSAITAIAERACRGTELAIVPIPHNYGILALEKFASPIQRSS